MPAMLPPQQLIEATYGRMMRLPDETQREFAKEKGAKEAGMRKADFEATMRRAHIPSLAGELHEVVKTPHTPAQVQHRLLYWCRGIRGADTHPAVHQRYRERCRERCRSCEHQFAPPTGGWTVGFDPDFLVVELPAHGSLEIRFPHAGFLRPLFLRELGRCPASGASPTAFRRATHAVQWRGRHWQVARVFAACSAEHVWSLRKFFPSAQNYC